MMNRNWGYYPSNPQTKYFVLGFVLALAAFGFLILGIFLFGLGL